MLDLRRQPVLVVGGGTIAYRKAKLLSKAAAQMFVCSPEIDHRLAELVDQSGGNHIAVSFNDQILDHADFGLIIAATDDKSVNAKVSEAAKSRKLWVNAVDAPALSNVIFPAIIDRDPVVVAVSSSGRAPVLARSVRSQIETSVPASIGVLGEFIGEKRDQVKALMQGEEIRHFWEDFVSSQAAESLMVGKKDKAELLFNQQLENHIKNLQESESTAVGLGEVFLIGAGPGDPDLLTFKALRLMQRADVVLYDRLVAEPIVEMCRRDAEFVYVGKARADHAVPQQEINQLLISYAMQGKKVARLKGGDPFIFGRGGEEIEGLSERGIPFQVVPGISAANGCASYAGIPLTHRDHAQSVRFVTGHLKDGSIDLPWSELVHPFQTLVVYMGLVALERVCGQLMAHGRDADTPIALIERGTTPNQVVHTGTLSTITTIIADRDVKAPTLIIVGSVVELHESLNWKS